MPTNAVSRSLIYTAQENKVQSTWLSVLLKFGEYFCTSFFFRLFSPFYSCTFSSPFFPNTFTQKEYAMDAKEIFFLFEEKKIAKFLAHKIFHIKKKKKWNGISEWLALLYCHFAYTWGIKSMAEVGLNEYDLHASYFLWHNTIHRIVVVAAAVATAAVATEQTK